MKKISAFLCGIITAAAVSASAAAESGYTLSHKSGTYSTPQFVTVSADSDTEVYYTTDGTKPTAESSVFGQAPLIITENTVIRTAAMTDGELSGSTKTTIKIRTAAPTSSAKSGTYNEPITLSLSCPDKSAVIYYTTDGSLPSDKCARYTAPLTICSDAVIRFAAYSENMAHSSVITRRFTFTDDVYEDPMRQELFDLVNKTRAEYGLSELAELPELSALAQQRAAECSTYFSHRRADGTKWDYLLSTAGLKRSKRAENICYYHATAQAALNSWLNDYAHRKNILDPDMKYLAVGYYNNGGCAYWTQLFLGE